MWAGQPRSTETNGFTWNLRDWSLITGRRGYKTEVGGGGEGSFTPTKSGGRIFLAMLKGGINKF